MTLSDEHLSAIAARLKALKVQRDLKTLDVWEIQDAAHDLLAHVEAQAKEMAKLRQQNAALSLPGRPVPSHGSGP